MPTKKSKSFSIKTNIKIDASPERVWEALVTPEQVKEYLFGADVMTDWEVGSPIVFQGIWEGKEYEDEGEILQLEPEKILQYTHQDHTVTFKLSSADGVHTTVSVSQDNIKDKKGQETSMKNWKMVLGKFKEVAEREGM